MKHLILFRTRRSGQPEACTPIGTLTGRARIRLWMALGVGIILAAGQLAILAVECGTTGNTYWTHTQAGATAGVAVDTTNIFWTSGSIISGSQKSGAGYFSRDFVAMTRGQPILVEQATGGTRAVVVAGSDGYIYGMDPRRRAPLTQVSDFLANLLL